jgi:hypothetical protein
MLKVVPRAYRAFRPTAQAPPAIRAIIGRGLARFIRQHPGAIDVVVREIGLARVWDAVDRLTAPASR